MRFLVSRPRFGPSSRLTTDQHFAVSAPSKLNNVTSASCLHSFLLSRFICSRRSVSLHLGLTPESYDPWSSSSLRSNLAAHDDSTLLCRSSPRLISIGQLHASQRFHLRPINDIVYVEPYSIKDERSNLRGSFTLRCLQRLSRPYVATQLCPWQDNWCTRGMSIPVLSY